MLNFKRVIICLSLIGLSQISMAQFAIGQGVDTLKSALATENKDTVAWFRGGMVNVGFNQGYLHNWPAGGELASLTVTGIANAFLVRFHHRHVWSNTLDMNYGLVYAYSQHFVPTKLDDRIEFTSKYGYRIDTARNFYLTGLLNFKSQLTKGFDYSVPEWDTFHTSQFFSPGYFILAAGMEYREGNNLQLFLSPLAARLTVADRYFTSRSPQGAFGIPYNETARMELGAYFSGRYKVDVTERLGYQTRIDLYANYLAKDKLDSLGNVVKKDNPGNVDILWDNLITWKATDFISLSLGATALYDNDIPYESHYTDETGALIPKNEPGKGLGWIQLRQQLTLGLLFRF